MRHEIARGTTLANLYRKAREILPELDISNDSVAYYAALVDYYTVQKLRQMPVGMVYLYPLCFTVHRYQKFNDNLITALIFHVRKVIGAAKMAAQEKILGYRLENNESLHSVSQILGLFLDDGIADDVVFGEIKRRAFAILEPDKFQRVSKHMSGQAFDEGAFEWEFVAAFGPTFKRHLRPLLMRLSFASQREDDALIEAVEFLKAALDKDKSLSRYRFEEIPKAFIPQGLKPYIHDDDANGQKRIQADKYEFLVCRLLRNHLESGDIYVSDSLRFRSFEEDLIPQQTWRDNKDKILNEIDMPALAKPVTELLRELETELEAQYEAVNRRILSGENAHIKLVKRRGDITWTLPYTRDEDMVNNPFFDNLPQISVGHVLQFVDSHCQCLDAFIHILNRYVKSAMDRQAIVASLVAYGTNVGLGKMGEISDFTYQALHTAANGFLRLETLREANDRVSNAVTKLPIFRHYSIGDAIHSSSDGQKIETQFHTIRSRHSPKYFGLKKGITQYTLVANHVPVNARFFGANEHESHFVFDVLYNNTADIQPTVHSTDTHGTNEVNFTILSVFGYQFAPRYRDIRSKTDTLYGFKHSNKYDEKFLLKPASKVNSQLVIDE